MWAKIFRVSFESHWNLILLETIGPIYRCRVSLESSLCLLLNNLVVFFGNDMKVQPAVNPNNILDFVDLVVKTIVLLMLPDSRTL